MEKEFNFIKKNRITMTIVVIVFIIYNVVIYTQGASYKKIKMSDAAIRGEQLYQENNCTACHQLYGLGGYLGPDLTNIISNKNKGKEYAKAFFNSGVKAMPKFNFSENEKEDLIAFLSIVDESGYYPNYEAEKEVTGWVELKYKDDEK